MHARALTFLIACLFPVWGMADPVFKKGINLSNWLQLQGSQEMRREDMVTIHSAGFDHVRIPLDPQFLRWTPTQPDVLPATFKRLDDGIAFALETGLNVILDLHLDDKFKEQVEKDPELEAAVGHLWAAMSRRYRNVSPEHLAYELFNEPQYYQRDEYWRRYEAALAATIRQIDAHRLLLLSGNEGGSIAGLRKLHLKITPPVAYTFHYYLPYIVTHQGASWFSAPRSTIPYLRHVPYPATMNSLSQVSLSPQGNPAYATLDLLKYWWEGWGPDKVTQQMQEISHWAKVQGVSLICTEYGVYGRYAASADRYRWILDTRGALEHAGIAWSLWDYADGFAVTERTHREGAMVRKFSAEATSALDLHVANAE